MELKICSRCKEPKEKFEFGVKKAAHDGLQPHCKECEKLASRKKYLKNREKIIAREKQKYIENKDIKKKYDREYYQKNKRKRNNQHKKWVDENRDRIRALNNSRKRRLKEAELDGYRDKILSIYANCPEGHHVDHIMPLNHPDLCGLHVPWNLQYLPAEENLRKSNKYGQ